jgi:hypothetical protein
MVEQLREFKVTFYSDSNKATHRKVFSMDDYDSIKGMLDDIKALIERIKEEGILESF